MPTPLRVLIVGTGSMAATHVGAFASLPGVEVVAGVDTHAERLAAFCAAHGIARGFASVEAALDWGGFDAAANATPDAAHFATTMPLLRAGRHVLCEKPLATNAADAGAMADAATDAGVVGMINLTYRNLPALQEAARLVRLGTLGAIRHLEASYLQSWLLQPAWGDWRTQDQWLWRLSSAHGSKGVLGDIGIHILDFAGFAAGQEVAELSCRLATFDKAPGGRIGIYVLDANDSTVMQVRMSGGALGTVSATRMASGHLNDLALRLFGESGALEVSYTGGVSRLRGCLGPDMPQAIWREIEAPAAPGIHTRFVAAIRGDGVADPDFARGAALQQVLDAAETSAVSGHWVTLGPVAPA